jgi:hypothetical protein
LSSNAIATGAATNGGAATNSIRKPGLIRNDARALVASADGTRPVVFDPLFESADETAWQKKPQAATASAHVK